MPQFLNLVAVLLSFMTPSRGNAFQHVSTTVLIGKDYQGVKISECSQENDVVRKWVKLGAKFLATKKVNFTLCDN